MVKDTVRIVLSGLAMSLTVLPSVAQTPAPPLATPRRPFYLTAGGFVPLSGHAVELGGVVYSSLAFSYFPVGSARDAQRPGNRLGLRLDYTRGQSNIGEVSSVGISPVYQRTGGRLRGTPLHYGLSLGIFRTQAKELATDTTPGRSESKTGLGGRVFAGMEFVNNVFAEVSFNEFPGAMGAHPRGFSVHLGTRF